MRSRALAAPGSARIAGWAALTTLAAACLVLAAPGREFVPGSLAGAPDWLLGVYGDGLEVSSELYEGALYVALAASLVVAICAPALGRRTVVGAIVAAVGLFALAPPLLSLDVFSYIAYGRLGVEGLNPYDFAPADLPHDEAARRVVDYRDASSVYGSGFTLLTYPLAKLGVPGALWTLKAMAAASVLVLAALVARLARVRGLDGERAAALVALNPITLVHVVGGAHNEGLMMALVIAGGLLVYAGCEAWAGWALVGAFAVKATAGLTAPFALLGSKRPRRLAAGALASFIALAIVTVAVFGTAAIDALASLRGNQEQVSHRAIPSVLARATGLDVDAVRVVLAVSYIGLVAWLLAWTARGGDWLRAAGWASFGLLVATAYITPWYVLWALPLAVVARDRTLLGAVLVLSAYQLTVAVP